MVKERKYYDSDPDKSWKYRIDVLYIKREHRRILNARPLVYPDRNGLIFLFVLKVMSN